MPYNIKLAEQIETALLKWQDVEKKKMFGGICYLVNGNMCFGVYKDYLIVRMDAELAAEKLRSKNVRPFDITGRPMKGWVMVRKNLLNSSRELNNWMGIGRSYALTLPPKPSHKKSLEEIYYKSPRP
jgi:TfoX/Sxy family transcriptional regulator of competence genes